MTLFSAIAGVWLLNGDNNVFTQISLIVLVGLACKNAILIVEFAREKQLQEGMNRVDAVAGSLPVAFAADLNDFSRLHDGRHPAGAVD